MSLFFCLSGISMGQYCQKSLSKRCVCVCVCVGGRSENQKKYKKGGWPYRGGEVPIEGGDSKLLHTMH